MKIEPSKVSRVLVVGLSCIGDTLLSTPALYNLRCFLPHAHFTMAANAQVGAMLKDDPLWNEITVYDRGQKNSKYNGWIGRLRAIRDFRAGKYDLIIDLRSTLIPLVMNCRYRPLWGWRELFLSRRLHEAERNLCCVSSLGVPLASRNMRLYVPPRVRNDVRRQLAFCKGRLVILNPGGKPFKRWSAENFAELGKRLENLGYQTAVMGYSPDEQSAAAPLLDALPKALNFTGEVPMALSATRLGEAKLYVTNDCGQLHMASAMGTPTVAIFGPTDPWRYGPWGTRHEVLSSHGCPKGFCLDEGAACPVGRNNCLKSVSVEEVWQASLKVLGNVALLSSGKKASDGEGGLS
ncbi:MAG: glycosyltransferase family 9 protein [Pyramidobacter sp.]|jgi:ADP-heptose:LPS heptosyltransferase